MVAKNIVVGSPGTHFIHMRVKNFLMVIEMFCYYFDFEYFAFQIFAERFEAFFTLKFSSNTGTIFAPFDCLHFPFQSLV